MREVARLEVRSKSAPPRERSYQPLGIAHGSKRHLASEPHASAWRLMKQSAQHAHIPPGEKKFARDNSRGTEDSQNQGSQLRRGRNRP